MKFKVGLVGLGTVSSTHIRALQRLDNVEIVACSDIDSSKRPIEGARWYTSYQEMASAEKLDAVHICLPHYLHLDAVKAFAARGINILCEKPIAMTVSEIEQMKAIEKESKWIVGVCLQNRWNASFIELKKQLAAGDNRKVIGIKAIATWDRPAAYYEKAPWRGQMSKAGGGCMINQAIHTLDLMLQIGGRVQKINGSISKFSDIDMDVEDTASAKIDFSNGIRGLFFGSVCNAQNSSIELQVYCEKGTFTIKDYSLWYNPIEDETEKILLVRDEILPGEKVYYGASHVFLIHDFYEVLAGKSENYVSISDAGQVIQLIQGIRKSSTENKSVKWEEIL